MNQSEVTLEWLLLTGVLGWEDLDLPRLEPHVQTRVHPTRNIREGHALVYAILEERDRPIACVVENAQPGCHLFTLTPVAKDRARLQAVFVDGDKFERPDVPVDGRRRVFPEGRSQALLPLLALIDHAKEQMAFAPEYRIYAHFKLNIAIEDV